ncbi:MAG: response regulator [Vicinamibacteria bacterium]
MSRGRRLLVLDDDASILALLRTYFSGLGWSVEVCADAAAALGLAGSEAPFDAIISDLHFTPELAAEGLDIVARARERRPGAAVILFTASNENHVHAEALVRGADEVIVKPAPLARLREAALRGRRRP